MSRNFNGSTDELFLAAGAMAGCTHGTFAAIFRVDDTAASRTVYGFITSGGAFVFTPMQIGGDDVMTWNGATTFGSAIPQNTWLCVVVRKPTGTVLARMSYYRYDTGAWVHTASAGTQANFTAVGGTDLITPATDASGGEGFDGDVALLAGWANHLPWATDASGDAALEASGLQWDLRAWFNSYGHGSPPSFASAGAGAITEASGGALSPASPATVDAGNLLIIFAYYEGITTTPSTPSGFTLLDGPRTLASNVGRCWVFGKIADGTEDGAANALGTPAVTTMRAARCYRFINVRSDTVANVVGGFGFDGPASAATINDVGVTTPEANCLAVNLVTVADDNAVVSFTGETGGDWTEALAEFTSAATTPDYCQQLQTAPLAAAGTINGGSQTMAAADPWGVVGFYIRGAGGVAANPPTHLNLFDQSAVTQAVIDLTGNGSNQSGTLVGTTVGTSEPPGFGYGSDPVVSPGHAAGAGAVALEGTSNAVAEHSGSLALALPLAGTANTVSEHGASLALALPLAATSSAVSEHTGTLGLAVPLAGTADGVAEHTGTATLTIGLTGTLDAVAEHVASPSLSLGLSGIAFAVAENAGVLSLALALGGMSDAVSEHLGSLGLSLSLSGTSDSIAEHVGLLGLALPLQAVADAVAEATADLTLQGQVQLEGVAEAVAEHVGTLSLAVELVGVSSSVAEHTGSLGFSYDLAAVSSAVAEHAGTMQLTLALDAVTNAVAEHTGSVSLAVGLTGVSSVVAEHVGDLLTGADIALDGVSSAIAEVVGAIDLIPAVFVGVDLGSGGYHPAGLGARAGSGSLGVGQVGSHLGDGS